MEKKGQIYLIATFVVISAIVGLAIVGNNIQKEKGNEVVYELRDELEIESEYVLDYISINNEDMETEIEQFAEDFSKSSEQNEFYFVFGEGGELSSYKYTDGEKESFSHTVADGKIKVNVEGTEYSFDLSTGKNFYFVISNKDGDEKNIATN